ncbi:helix-turn-helix domain-containing protein [Paenibacillus sp. R14(2021)]|uniref:response regulator transcription factor n=1 Tax=Paenibacillus sp. R14(2021) TaxID=2859228 RepID=UPI001C61161E|nr:helix-turn-helix domain-containing protein [Paenibacillus sp. R14(2021)]
MYKVMVVDDEYWGRKSIVKMINELSADVGVIAEAKHGDEALELIRINKPHIIVTDMNMPVMNGEKLLEVLYTQYSEIRVIVISGYSQFEYLKAALKYQACEYVLKPVSVTELGQAVAKAIEASRAYMSAQQQKKSTIDIMKLKREEFLQHVTSRRITNVSDIQQQLSELHIRAMDGPYRLAVCSFRQLVEIARIKFHGNADLLMYSLENMLYEVLQDEAALMYKSDDQMSICLVLPESSYNEQRTRDVMNGFHTAVKQVLKLDVIIGISGSFGEITKLPEAYKTAADELGRNPFNDDTLSITIGERPGLTSKAALLTAFDLNAISQALGSGSERDSRRLLSAFVERVRMRKEATIHDVQRELAKIVELASTELKGCISAQPSLFDTRLIAGVLDLKHLQAWMEQLADAMAGHGQSNGKSESVQSIGEVVAYLDTHYFEDVSLVGVATRFHMDPSYLSKLFKSVTDENFIEYVTRKRMEKACELLRSSDHKIQDISELVGYENQRYFSQVFKKFTDQTPSEYRELSVKK